MVCFIISSVGLDDCDAMALIGHNNVLSTALPRKRNFPHTCWMNFFPLASNRGAVDDSVAYCFLAPYLMGMLGYGACCSLFTTCWNCLRAFLKYFGMDR